MDNVQSQDFAKVCIKNGITVLDSTANREKAKLIAKHCGISDYENLPILQQAIDKYIASEREKKNKERTAQIKALKDKASEEGLPYQTMITSIIHKYLTGALVDINEARKIIKV